MAQAEVTRLRQTVIDLVRDRGPTYEAVKHFTTRRVNRLTLETLEKHTCDYHKLDELDGQLAAEYANYISKVEESELETAGDMLAPSKFEALFEEYGAIKDKAVEMFNNMAQTFPDHLKVKEHLKFLSSQVSALDLPLPASSESSSSSALNVNALNAVCRLFLIFSLEDTLLSEARWSTIEHNEIR